MAHWVDQPRDGDGRWTSTGSSIADRAEFLAPKIVGAATVGMMALSMVNPAINVARYGIAMQRTMNVARAGAPTFGAAMSKQWAAYDRFTRATPYKMYKPGTPYVPGQNPFL